MKVISMKFIKLDHIEVETDTPKNLMKDQYRVYI